VGLGKLLDPKGLFPYETRLPGRKTGFLRETTAMARRCELTGKGTLVGNHVSHANNKTKRIYRPNLQTVSLVSEILGNSYKLKISMNALRSVDRNGGLDPFLLKSKDGVLSAKALRLKRAIAKKTAKQAA
jgi:large subunit ribosomal protein L28